MSCRHQQLQGVGIDLVSQKRVKGFLGKHKAKAFSQILTPFELRAFEKNKKSVLHFSKILAAKEAFFKALNRNWLGLDGFKQMEVRSEKRNVFKIRLIGQGLREGQGSFFQVGQWVGAQVMVWDV